VGGPGYRMLYGVQILPREVEILLRNEAAPARNVTYRKTSSLEKTAEPIELPFAIVSGVGARNRVLDGRARWRHLANTIE